MTTMTTEERAKYRAELNEKFKSVWPKGIPEEEWTMVEGSVMHAPVDTHTYMTEVRDFMTSNVQMSGVAIPRYGLLSMKARNSPMFVYGADCKPFMDISTTGFSDGRHIFISSLWLRQLMEDQERSNDREQGVLPWMMHHVMHLLRNHTRRLKVFDPEIAERAKDMSINLDLQRAFAKTFEGRQDIDNGLVFSKTLKTTEAGFEKGDAAKFGDMAEETIARVMTTDAEKKKLEKQAQQKPQPQPGQGQPDPNGKGGKGQPDPNGQPGDGEGEPGEGDGGEPDPNAQPGSGGGKPDPKAKGKKGKAGKGQPGDEEGDEAGNSPWDQTHNLPMEKLSKVIEDNPELDKIKGALDLPDSDNLEEIGKMEQKSKLKDMSDLQKAMAQKAQLGGKYPGGHIVDAEAERVKADTEGKLNYKLAIRQFITGEGNQYQETYDVPGLLSYVDPGDMGLGDNEGVYVPEEIPARPDAVGLVIMDTSGSMHGDYMRDCLTEIMWLKKNNGVGDTASEIYVFSADTCIRGEPEQITEENFEEILQNGVNVYGRGGTDFATPLRELLNSKVMKEKKPAFVLYFTDLCASIPKKSDFPSNLPIAFVCAPSDYSLEFARGVKDWAMVATMEEGVEIDLTEDGFNQGPIDKRPVKGNRR